MNKWISVNDELPEYYVNVLITDGTDIDVGAFQPISRSWTLEMWWIDNPDDVTHWMPLPEPPKEEK